MDVDEWIHGVNFPGKKHHVIDELIYFCVAPSTCPQNSLLLFSIYDFLCFFGGVFFTLPEMSSSKLESRKTWKVWKTFLLK